MKILVMDSSAVSASVAISNDTAILGEFYTNTGLTHSQTLMPMCEALLKNTQTSLDDIDAFAVCKGPGSFTGLRIGIASVKGMAMALDKPCVAVSTLECIAYGGVNLDGIICAVMDARCNQVYNALFRCKDGELERICDDRAIAISELEQELADVNEKIYLLGDGAYITKQNLSDDKYILPASNNVYQRASSLALLAERKFKNNDIVSPEQLMPTYLRLPQAERELNNKKLNGGIKK